MPGCGPLAEVATMFAGKAVVVDFWASWCPPCRKALPFLDTLYAEHAAQGLTVIAVNVDEERADADAFLARRSLALPLVFDGRGECPQAFDVQAMPSTYLVDRRGVVRGVRHGFREAEREEIRRQIAALLVD